MTPHKTFHFNAQMEYHLTVLLDTWIGLTALIEASTSILAGEGYDVSGVPQMIARGDKSLLALFRKDKLT